MDGNGGEMEGILRTLRHCLYFAKRGSHSSDVAVPRRYSVCGECQSRYLLRCSLRVFSVMVWELSALFMCMWVFLVLSLMVD